MAFCTTCGAKIEEGVKFCSGCGKAVGGVPVESGVPVAPTFQPQPAVIQTQSQAQAQTITADE
jgi:hypothetical protein